MKLKNKLLWASLTMLLVSTIVVEMLSMVNMASSSPSTYIYATPEVIDKTGQPIGTNVLVEMYVNEAPETYAWMVYVSWDPNALTLFYILEGEFLHRGPLGGPKLYQTGFAYNPITFDEANIKGEIKVGCYLSNSPPDPWATGNGRLFRLGFKVKTLGRSTLINLFDTSLDDHLEGGAPAPTTYPNRDSFFYNVSPSHDISGRERYIEFPNKTVGYAVYAGEEAKINVTVLNEGTVNEMITLNVYANTSLIKTVNLPLNGGLGLWGSFENRSYTYTVNWNTAGFALGKYYINASVPAVSGEADTADNNFKGAQQLTILPVGDINRDGSVDGADLAMLAEVYGTTSTSSNWNMYADTNKDNIINALDLFLLGKNYGKKI